MHEVSCGAVEINVLGLSNVLEAAKKYGVRRVVTASSRDESESFMEEPRQEGKASRLLSDIHGWFTEGFDTADLKDAKTLLDELS